MDMEAMKAIQALSSGLSGGGSGNCAGSPTKESTETTAPDNTVSWQGSLCQDPIPSFPLRPLPSLPYPFLFFISSRFSLSSRFLFSLLFSFPFPSVHLCLFPCFCVFVLCVCFFSLFFPLSLVRSLSSLLQRPCGFRAFSHDFCR